MIFGWLKKQEGGAECSSPRAPNMLGPPLAGTTLGIKLNSTREKREESDDKEEEEQGKKTKCKPSEDDD